MALLAGEHRVIFRFAPASLSLGLGLGLAGLLGLATLLFLDVWGRRPRGLRSKSFRESSHECEGRD